MSGDLINTGGCHPLDGSAKAGTDYTATSGTLVFLAGQTLTIPAGSTTGTIIIGPSGATAGEIDENFTLELFDPVNAVLAGGVPVLVANGTILEGVGASLFTVPVFAFEDGVGEATFTIHLSKALATDIVVPFTTINGTATAGSDYVATSGNVTFLAGQTEASVTVQLLSDGIPEGNEAFSLSLTPPIGIENGSAGATATATIVDGAPAIRPGFAVFTSPDLNGLAGIFSSFAAAEAAANNGNTIFVADADAIGNIGQQTILTNNLTIIGEASFAASFNLGAPNLTIRLSGDGLMNVTGNGSAETLIGGSGPNTLIGSGGNDTLTGGAGNDILFGGAGNDTFFGGAGNDTFFIGEAGDFVNGGTGTDRARVDNAAGVNLSIGTWTSIERVDGAAGNDTIDATGITTTLLLTGGAGADTLIAGSAVNTLQGGAGNDTLIGGAASDFLFGDAGADMMTGNGGNDQLFGGGVDLDQDTFVFADGSGVDTIRDWEAGVDLMDISGITGIAGLGDLTIDQSSGTNTVITAGAETITLRDFIGTVDASDFIF